MRRAVNAGVDSIEHGTYMDAATFELMKTRGTWYVPTVLAGVFVSEKSREIGYYPEIVRPKAARIGALIQGTLGRAYAAGLDAPMRRACESPLARTQGCFRTARMHANLN